MITFRHHISGSATHIHTCTHLHTHAHAYTHMHTPTHTVTHTPGRVQLQLSITQLYKKNYYNYSG